MNAAPIHLDSRPLRPRESRAVAPVEAKQDGTSYDARGVAGGVFVGLGQKFGKHFMLTMDVGAYWVQLHEQGAADSSEMHFVGDASVLFMFW